MDADLRIPWRGLLLALAVSLAGCGRGEDEAPGASAASARSRPDIVLLVIDTLRADAILDPDGHYDTPNLDRLGREGIVFTQAFAHAPMTLPSHTSLFSSRPPLETSVLNNGQEVPADLPLLAGWLAEQGYESRAVLSLGTLNPVGGKTGLRRGFDAYDVRFWCMAPAENTTERLSASLEGRDPAKPLFLFAHYADPHEPYNAHGTQERSAELRLDGELLERVSTADMTMWVQTLELAPGRHVFDVRSDEGLSVRLFECWEKGRRIEAVWEESKPLERTKLARIALERPGELPGRCEVKVWITDAPATPEIRRRYALEVAYVDRSVGELLARLEELGLYRDSLIAFTSDHGEALGEHGVFGHVEGLTDDLIHVPLILKLPAGDPRSERLARSAGLLVPHIDLVPTLLDLAGLPPLPGQRGTSLLAPHESVHLAETHRPEAKKNQLCLRDERFKMIYLADEERFLLYDLERDPCELEDVFAAREGERPAWAERLRALARASAERTQGSIDEASQRELEALGYGGGE